MLKNEGNTEVWYMKPEFFRDGIMGVGWLREQNLLPDPEHLEKTHIKLGHVKEDHPDAVFIAMQGENWSPNGEANTLIQSKGLAHTSMSVGDVCVCFGQAFIADVLGFKLLASLRA